MKKIILSLMFIVLALFVYSQPKYGTEYINESFSSGVPPTGWTIENYVAQWTSSASANAGGTAPELKFTYINGSLTTRFISPQIDLTGVTNLKLNFNQFVDHYGSGYTIGVATRSNSGTWNTIWTTNPSGNIGPEVKEINITNGDLGAVDFQICFFLSGNAYQIDYWYIDNVILFTPFANDITLLSTDVPAYSAQGDKTIDATVKNVGENNLTSFDISYQIDGGEIFTENITGIDIANGGTHIVNFTDLWTSIPGNYNLDIWVENMNGNGNDDDIENDTLSKILSIATQTTVNFPLIESFTSSTCPPCYTFNTTFFNSFLTTNEGNLAIIKYQMNWPGSGDIYYTAEGGVRRTFYGVSFVPDLFIGGSNVATTSTGVNTAFAAQNAKDAFFSITSDYVVDGTTIDVNIDIMPYITAQNFTIQTAVVEKVTTGNVGSNGETSFHYVMMKMLPNASGTLVNFVAEENYNLTFSQDISATNIEEFTDLTVMIFIQNNTTKEVFQAAIAEQGATPPGVSLNILDGQTNVSIDEEITLTFTQPMRLINNDEITNDNISTFITLTDPTKAIIDFTATINPEKTLITITPIENFEYNTLISFELTDNAIENENDIALQGFSYSFTTEEFVGMAELQNNVNIYPNPAKDYFIIENAKDAEVKIYNTIGMLVSDVIINTDNYKIDTSDFNSGTYIVKISSDLINYTNVISVIK
jgi:hypothetical protein